MFKEFKLTDGDCFGIERAIARVIQCRDKVDALVVLENESGWHYWIFDDIVSEKINSKKRMIKLMNDNQLNGFSVGAFDTLAEIDSDLRKEEITDFGFFS